MACVSVLYCYYNRFCLSEISGLVPEIYVFLRNNRFSQPAYPYVVDWPVDRTIPYGKNSFFSWTIRMVNTPFVQRLKIFGFYKMKKA